MKMTVKLHAGHNVHVTFTRVGDDAAQFVLRKPGIVGKHGIASQLDTRFRVEVILIALPASQKNDLALDLIFGWQRPVAHVHHNAAVRKGWPIADFGFRKCGFGARSLDQLKQSLNAIEQASRRVRANFRALGGDVDRVSLARVRSRLLARLWKVGARACAPKHDHALARLTLRYLNGDLGARQEPGRQFVCREPVLRGGAESKPYLQAITDASAVRASQPTASWRRREIGRAHV